MGKGHAAAAGLGLALGLSAVAAAGEPFLITAETTSGTAQSVTVAGHNLPNMLGNFIKDEKQFSGLTNQSASATLRYGGMNNAAVISKNANNTSATITLPGIGFTKTFNANSEDSLERQIKNWARKDGASVYGQFIRSVNQSTEIGVTDGNPLAATALLAKQAYSQFGLTPTPWRSAARVFDPLEEAATPNIRLDLDGGYAHSDSRTSYFVSGAFTAGIRFGDNVGLVFATPFTFQDVQGATVYDLGEEVSLPIVIVNRDVVSWMLTPTFVVAGAGSVDLASGGVFLGGGITSSLSIQAAGFIFTLADNFDYFHGFPLRAGEYKFETDLDQEILKNGIKIARYFGESFFIDGGISYTSFIERAAVNEYWSPQAGLGWRFGAHSGLRVGYTGDFGHDFVVHGGDVQLYWNW